MGGVPLYPLEENLMTQILPITQLEVGLVTPAVLVCGDPARATMIVSQMESVVQLSKWREYRAYRGVYDGVSITVCSHGVGAPGAAIAFEELIAAGAQVIMRVGSCGGLQPAVQSGDLVVALAAVNSTGYGRELVPAGFPAVAHPDCVLALRAAGHTFEGSLREGIVLTRDAFYGGVANAFTPDYQQMSAAGVTAVEMECAALFLIGSLRGIRTGAILAVDGNVLDTAESMDSYQPHQEQVQAAIQAGIGIALAALVQLEKKNNNNVV